MTHGSASTTPARRPAWLLAVAAAATGFGVLTLVASSRVLFGSAAARAAEGDYVPFVLWFNFLAGFAYVTAGVALGLARPWAARLALGIAAATALVYAAFGAHVLLGGRFTLHTAQAMAVRTVAWGGIAAIACRRFGCVRVKRALGVAALAAVTVVGASTCGGPADTVRVHAGRGGAGRAGPTGRAPAPRMTVEDHWGRALDVPAPGQVTVLSFASRSTADLASARCRAVRVAHPDVVIVEIMDVSSAPGFLAGKVEGKLAARHETLVADTRAAFDTAGIAAPADLEDRLHIVADWHAAAFEAYGATDADSQAQIAVVAQDGSLASFFAVTPEEDELVAAVARAAASR